MRRAAKALSMASDAVRDGVFGSSGRAPPLDPRVLRADLRRLAAINKPCGQSSAQIIRVCQQHFNPSALFKSSIDAEVAKRLKETNTQNRRRRFEKRACQVKIGHGGTLDPLATGVLILGIGSATRLLPQFLDCTKTYETVVLFGATTDTYDRVGRVLTKRPYEHITKDMVLKELEAFRGKNVQMPPLYSALKMNGKPLYEYAREGKPIPREIKGRDVEALEVEMLEWYEPGSHNHRWPLDEAGAAERNLAEQVWSIKKMQETSKTLTPQEKKEDDQAIAEHETFKRKFEERQDELITDKPQRKKQRSKEPMMSGALGALPQPTHSTKGANLVPPAPDKSTPPPWKDKGPAACKVRLTVTSGYYVRSFCHDLGAKLGSGGIMAELCRTRQSDFTVGGPNTLEYDELARGEEVWGPKVADMLARWNGEPEGHWPVKAPPASAAPATPQSSSSPRPSQRQQPGPAQARAVLANGTAEKRKRSPATDARGSPSPRKLTARAADEKNHKPNLPASQARSDDEQSWNGIDG